jgi:predicted dehydrogenase
MDYGVHLVDLVLWLVGGLEVSLCNLIPAGAALEEEAKLEFRFSHDAYGVLRLSDRRMLPNVLRVEGEGGFFEFDTYDSPSLKVFLRGSKLCRNSGTVLFRWPGTSPYESQLEHFRDFLKDKETTLVNNGEEAIKSIGVVTVAYTKAQQAPV